MIKIVTDRLIIRDHVENDLNDLHSLISNEKVMYYLPEIRTKNIEASKDNLENAIVEAKSSCRKKYFFAIIDKTTEKYIGEIGFTKLIDADEGCVMELGYFINDDWWGQGIVSEAAKAVIDYAFSELNAIKIETGCIVDNVGSEKVMKKLGMTKEAHYIKHVLLDNKLFDRVEYRMMKEEWLN